MVQILNLAFEETAQIISLWQCHSGSSCSCRGTEVCYGLDVCFAGSEEQKELPHFHTFLLALQVAHKNNTEQMASIATSGRLFLTFFFFFFFFPEWQTVGRESHDITISFISSRVIFKGGGKEKNPEDLPLSHFY